MTDTSTIDSQASLLNVASISLLAVSTVAVVARLLVRARLVRSVLGSDWMMSISQALFIATCVTSMYAARYEKLAATTVSVEYALQLSNVSRCSYSLSANV